MNNLTKLNTFGFFTVTGRDAQKFLQGYTTCDLEDLDEGHVQTGAVCNIKGRMLCNFLICRTPDGFLLRLRRSLIEPTIAFLGKYIVFSKAVLEDHSETLHCYGLSEAADGFPQALQAISSQDSGRLIKTSAAPRFELWSPEEMTASGDRVAWEQAELAEGIIWVDETSSEEYIPQMFNLHGLGGISFSKGCYLGQEIVARMQYRGELKNRLHLGTCDASVAIGARVINPEGKSAGTIIAKAGTSFAAVLRTGQSKYTLEDGTPIDATEAA
jgi:folate-binding protein YgfZ